MPNGYNDEPATRPGPMPKFRATVWVLTSTAAGGVYLIVGGAGIDGLVAAPGDWIVVVDGTHAVYRDVDFQRRFEVVP